MRVACLSVCLSVSGARSPANSHTEASLLLPVARKRSPTAGEILQAASAARSSRKPQRERERESARTLRVCVCLRGTGKSAFQVRASLADLPLDVAPNSTPMEFFAEPSRSDPTRKRSLSAPTTSRLSRSRESRNGVLMKRACTSTTRRVAISRRLPGASLAPYPPMHCAGRAFGGRLGEVCAMGLAPVAWWRRRRRLQ